MANLTKQHSDDTDTGGVVVRYCHKTSMSPDLHEQVTRTELARNLAILKGYTFAGDYDPARRYPGHVYFVPDDTLVNVQAVRELGIHNAQDLFGGLVPYPFVATKTITHPARRWRSLCAGRLEFGFKQRSGTCRAVRV